MPNRRPSDKNEKRYGALKKKGMSKEREEPGTASTTRRR